MSAAPTTWTVSAVNLPEHADNPIHTDAGARADGFPAALVAGTTVYAYLTRPVVAAWGDGWLAHGGGEVTFLAPVFAGGRVDCVATTEDDGTTLVEAVCPDQARNPRATFRAVRDAGRPVHRDGEPLPDRRFRLGVDIAHEYARRAGDDLTLYDERSIVHPVAWLQIANRIFATDLVDGAWVHTRSIVRHHAVCPRTATVDVSATVIDRFHRRGERAVVDVLISLDGAPVATIEHEAIVDLTATE